MFRKVKRSKLRPQTGLYLVELLAALFISGFLSVVLGSSLAQLISLSSSTEQTQIAGVIAQEIIDRMRNVPYSTLQSWSGTTYYVRINSVDSGDATAYAPLQPIYRSLQLDDSTFAYTTGAGADGKTGLPAYIFGSNISATATVLLSPGQQPNMLQATITVNWNAAGKGQKTYTCGAIFCQNGTQTNAAQ